MTKSSSLFIAIDSGGTNTRGLLADHENNMLQTYQGSGSNPKDIGWEAAYAELKNCIRTLLGRYPNEKLERICITAAGIGDISLETPDVWGKALAIKSDKLIITGDVFTAHVGAFMGGDGIMVIAGTGSSLFARKGAKTHRLGGWGNILGDQGSGYAIALAGIRKAVMDIDLGKETALTLALTRHYQINNLQDLVDIVYNAPKAIVAKFAKEVINLAQKSDTDSQAIIQNELQAFCLLLKRFQDLGYPKKVSYIGGLFGHPFYLNAFSEAIHSIGFELIAPQLTALEAAMQIALGKLEPVYA